LVHIDAQDITSLSQQFGKLASALLEAVKMPGMPLHVETTIAGNFRGYDSTQFYVVQSGSLTARYQGKTLYTLEESDILLPDIAGELDQNIAVFYGSDAGAQLHSYPALEFMQRIFDEPAAEVMDASVGHLRRVDVTNCCSQRPGRTGCDAWIRDL
jgi:hypothetical protein